MDLDELDELDPVEVVDESTSEREFGIIIYGATGFTGCLMVEHLDALVSHGGARSLKWAIAGRDLNKLRRVARKCKSTPEVIKVSDAVEITQMVGRCRVVANAAGPAIYCGEDIVRACVNQITHYVDVSGETIWIHDMIDKYHAKAKEKGAMIVHCLGETGAPEEMMSYTLVKKLGPLKQYREYFFQYGTTSGGTFGTNIATMETLTPERFVIMNDPFSLGGVREGGVRESDKDCTTVEEDAVFPSLFVYPSYNTTTGSRLVRRSCSLFEEAPGEGVEYGRNFVVTVRDAGISKKAAEAQLPNFAPLPSAEAGPFAAQQMRESRDRKEAAQPGEGPPGKTRSVYFAEVFGVAEGENGKWAHCRYTCGEAYEATAMICIAGALVLVEELDKVRPKERGGILSPAYAFHESTWIERITSQPFAANAKMGSKIAMEILDGLPPEDKLKTAVSDKMRKAMQGQGLISEGKLTSWEKPEMLSY